MSEQFENHGPQAKLERIEKKEDKLEREKLELELENLLKEGVTDRLIDPIADRVVLKSLGAIKRDGRDDLDGMRKNVDGFRRQLESVRKLPALVRKLDGWAVTQKLYAEVNAEITASFPLLVDSSPFYEKDELSVVLEDFTDNLDKMRALQDASPAEGQAMFTALGATPAKNTWGFELALDTPNRSISDFLIEKNNRLDAILTYREGMKASQQ